MKTEQVIDKLRLMRMDYAQRNLGLDPGALPHHLAEFLGYATLLSSHYAEALKRYYTAQGTVIAEEIEAMEEVNSQATKREDRRTASEKDDRITVRMSKLKANKEFLKEEVGSAQTHINTIQSLLKRYGDEAKGIM